MPAYGYALQLRSRLRAQVLEQRTCMHKHNIFGGHQSSTPPPPRHTRPHCPMGRPTALHCGEPPRIIEPSPPCQLKLCQAQGLWAGWLLRFVWCCLREITLDVMLLASQNHRRLNMVARAQTHTTPRCYEFKCSWSCIHTCVHAYMPVQAHVSEGFAPKVRGVAMARTAVWDNDIGLRSSSIQRPGAPINHVA